MNAGDPVFATGDRQVETKTAAQARAALAVQGTAEKGVANGYASLGADGKVPAAQIPTVSSDPATYIHAAAEKTPENDDEFTFVDSAASWVLRKIKWSSMVSIFSGLFSAVGHTHAGVYEPADADIQAHVTGTGSPHTAAGVGADVAGAAVAAVGSHESSYNHALLHSPVTVGEGLSLFGQHVANTDLGSVAVTGHEEDYDHTKLHDPVTVTGNGIQISGQQVSLKIGSGADEVPPGNHTHSLPSHYHAGGDINSGTVGYSYLPVGPYANHIAAGDHDHAGDYEPSGAATGAVIDHEESYDHSKLHDPVTVAGNGLTLFGQQVTLNVGEAADHVASGIHDHDGVYRAYIKDNLTATTAPTAGDDSGDGYAVGSRWVDVSADKEYVCLDATLGAAVWTETTQSGGGTVDRSINMFRITTESGVPVSTSDRTAQTTIYACPAAGGATEEAQISLLGTDDATWETHDTAQMSIGLTTTRNGTTTNGSAVITGLAKTVDLVVGQEATGTGIGGGAVISTIDSDSQVTLSANSTASATVSITFKCPAGAIYDTLIANIAGTPTLAHGPAWTSALVRSTALTVKDGVKCLAGTYKGLAEGRWRSIGAVKITATAGETEDSYRGGTTVSPKRFIWSRDNQVERDMMVEEDTDHTYNSTTWQQMRAQADNQVEFIVGEPTVIHARASGFFTNNPGVVNGEIGIGLNRTNANDAQYGAFGAGGITYNGEGVSLDRQVAAGYHYIAIIERCIGASTVTFMGSTSTGFNSQRTTISAEVRG